MQQAILELEPTFRECLVLRDVEDLSYEEIGAITGLPEGTVKSRIHRARAPAQGDRRAGARREASMSDPHDASNAAELDERDDRDDAEALAVRSLLKRAFGANSAGAEPPPDLLPGVQRRIRVRSRGKFFADGWSTTQARMTYALVGLLTSRWPSSRTSRSSRRFAERVVP